MAQYDVDLRDYWRVLRKRKAIVVLTVLLLGIFSYGFASFREPAALYEASASVKIEKVSNLANMLLGIFTYSSGDNIVTQAAIITSFPVLEQAAKELGWIPKETSSDEVRASRHYLGTVDRLKKMVTTEQERDTSIIEIKVLSSNAEEAAHVANVVATAYRNFNIFERNRQTLETRDFIEKQLQLTMGTLKKAEEDLRKFKEDKNLTALDAQTAGLLSNLNATETEYERVRSRRQEIESQLRALKQEERSDKAATQSFYADDPHSLLGGLSARFSDLTLRKKTLLLEYTAEHPQVKELEGQIKGVLNEIIRELTPRLTSLKIREANLLQSIEGFRKRNLGVPDIALQMARLEREVRLHETLYTELKTKYQETLIQESGRIEEVTIIRPAVAPKSPTNLPSKVTATTTGLVIGVIIGIVLALVSETLDTSIGTIEDVEGFLQVPVLGIIPFTGLDSKLRDREEAARTTAGGRRGLITHFEPKSIVAEAYRSLRTNVQFLELEQKGKTVMLTSSSLQEGKTFNVVNLALSLAQAGEKVMLIDADLRRPSIYKMFGLEKEPGVTDYVMGNYSWREVVNTITDVMLGEFEMEDILRTPGLDNLSIVTAGSVPPNPSEILSAPRFDDLLAEARDKYDVILIDAPPVLPVADAAEIGTKVDGAILVYEVGKIARGVLKRAKATLDAVGAKVVGVILNNVKPEISTDFYTYHYRYYGSDGPKKNKRAHASMATGFLQPFKDFLRKDTVKRLVLTLALVFLLAGILWGLLFTGDLSEKPGAKGASSFRGRVAAEKPVAPQPINREIAPDLPE